MMKRTSWTSALAALSVLSMTGAAAASSHREAPGIADDPAADNTDTYAWVQGSNLVVVANYIGLEMPEGGPNWAKFSDDVLYQIHIARGGTSLADALTYQIRFTTAAPTRVTPGATPLATLPATQGTEFFAQLTGSTGFGTAAYTASGAFGQTYTVTQLTNGGTPTVIATNVQVPPPNVGPETNAVAYGITGTATYESFWVDSGKTTGMLTGGGSVFAGPRDDPFFVDLGAIFDLAQLRPVFNGTSTQKNRDSIQYTNVHSIVIQIPLTVANAGAITPGAGNVAQTVGIWASASRRKVRLTRRTGGDANFGPWVQVSRLGLPLINEAVIGLQDKDYWNHLTPADDLTTFGAYFLNPIVVRDADALGFYGTALAPCANAEGGTGHGPQSSRMDIIGVIDIGETIGAIGDVLRVDLGATTSGFPNGRLLTDDVVNTELSLLLCGASNLAANPLGAAGTAASLTGAFQNETTFKTTFPYLASPWEGRTATPRAANNP
jgi:Domain of unknown function (DUF4331)